MITEHDFNIMKAHFTCLMEHNSRDKHLVLTDDIDSLMTCLFLKNRYNIPIGAFFDFRTMVYNPYVFQPWYCDGRRRNHSIFVDCAVVNWEYNVDQHVTCRNIPVSLNVNTGIAIGNNKYISKYAGSTYLTTLIMAGINVNELPENELLFLLLIDSFYAQYYREYNNTWDTWVNLLGCQAMTEIVRAHPKEYFENLQREFKIAGYGDDRKRLGKIWIKDDGHLDSNIDFDGIRNHFGIEIELPDIQFNYAPRRFRRDVNLIKWIDDREKYGKKCRQYRKQLKVVTPEEVATMYTCAMVGTDVIRYSIPEFQDLRVICIDENQSNAKKQIDVINRINNVQDAKIRHCYQDQ